MDEIPAIQAQELPIIHIPVQSGYFLARVYRVMEEFAQLVPFKEEWITSLITYSSQLSSIFLGVVVALIATVHAARPRCGIVASIPSQNKRKERVREACRAMRH